ncbi:MAG: helix-turn-helix transcriptional regulator [Mogibacterium sp.]|nr:helix-turn-helix transcriptional regulator [Mogibacterium sp.]
MILADKIIENRKKNGWSQEELADRLGVSRQSVSKWEGAQAVPDIKKIIQMADLFGVSTDYLLKDEVESAGPQESAPVDAGIEDEVRQVSMEEASAFLEHNERAARTISTGVMLCILSPVASCVLDGFAEIGLIDVVSEEIVGIVGVVILLLMVAAAIAMFLLIGMRGREFEYLEQVSIDTAYGVSGMAKERRAAYSGTHSRLLILGIILCVISAVPLLLMTIVKYSNNTDVLPVIGTAVMLIMVAVGVKMIVLTCIRQGGYDRLLEEGDYTRLNKRAGKYDGIYWAIVLAIYLGWSFYNMGWQYTWVVWPIAGVLFAAYREIVKTIIRSRN